MPTKIKQARQLDEDSSQEPLFADIAAGMDNDRTHSGSFMFGAVKFIAVTLLAFVLASIWVMSMPGLIDDRIETIYFRIGDATTVDLPSYVQPKSVAGEALQTQDRRKQLTDFDFTPPKSAMTHITRNERFADNSASVFARSSAFEKLEVGIAR